MDYMKKYSKLLSCLLNWEEMEEIKRRGRLSDQTIEAFLKELHIYKMCDWAETNCLSDFLSFTTAVPFRNHRCQKGSDIALRHSFLLGQFC